MRIRGPARPVERLERDVGLTSAVFLAILIFAATVQPVGHTRACATGSMYIVTVHPERVKVGEAVNISISIAISEDVGPSIPLIVLVDTPAGAKTDFPLIVKINDGGFGKASMRYTVASVGNYTVILLKSVQNERTEVASKGFAVYGEATSSNSSERSKTQDDGITWLTISALGIIAIASAMLLKRLRRPQRTSRSRKG